VQFNSHYYDVLYINCDSNPHINLSHTLQVIHASTHTHTHTHTDTQTHTHTHSHTHTHTTLEVSSTAINTHPNGTCMFIFQFSYPFSLLVYEIYLKCSCKFPHEAVEIVLLKERWQTLKFASKLRCMNQVTVKPTVTMKAVPAYCSSPYKSA
jgi:hypothetical protein